MKTLLLIFVVFTNGDFVHGPLNIYAGEEACEFARARYIEAVLADPYDDAVESWHAQCVVLDSWSAS